MSALMLMAGMGGFAGTCCRYLTGVASKRLIGDRLPYGTLIVNLVGCFVFGIAVGLWASQLISGEMRAALVAGFCGGLTTFSSFGHDAYAMIEGRQWLKCAVYVAASVALGLVAVWLGMEIKM